ncbi:MAG TPA: L-threonylcarbamoyladenylate synthase [Patescibacteria group bacterium]|nr:L-threonylcarbamoyladenylate synthase [Patescibacteria group bacterium]
MVIISSLHDPRLPSLYAAGAVGVLPTDTLYGLSASAGNPEAIKRLYALKNRERKPGTLIAASVEQLIDLGLDELSLRQAAHLWPNSLSIIIPAPEALFYLHQGLNSLPVRIPKDPELLELLAKTGALATSSANHPGSLPANNLAEAQLYFSDRVDFYVDGGDRIDRPPSTVARIADGVLEVLRPGAVTINDAGEIV